MRARVSRKRIAVALRPACGDPAADKKTAPAQPFQRAAHRAFRCPDAVDAGDGLGNLPIGDQRRLRLEQAQDGNLHFGKTQRTADFPQGRLRGRLHACVAGRIHAGLRACPAAWAIPRRAVRLAPQRHAGIRGEVRACVHVWLRITPTAGELHQQPQRP